MINFYGWITGWFIYGVLVFRIPLFMFKTILNFSASSSGLGRDEGNTSTSGFCFEAYDLTSKLPSSYPFSSYTLTESCAYSTTSSCPRRSGEACWSLSAKVSYEKSLNPKPFDYFQSLFWVETGLVWLIKIWLIPSIGSFGAEPGFTGWGIRTIPSDKGGIWFLDFLILIWARPSLYLSLLLCFSLW